jgi:hypothetical protein
MNSTSSSLFAEEGGATRDAGRLSRGVRIQPSHGRWFRVHVSIENWRLQFGLPRSSKTKSYRSEFTSTDHESQPPIETPKRSRAAAIVSVAATVLAIGACAVAGVALTQAQQSQEELRESRGAQQGLGDRLDTIEAEIAGVGSDLADTQSAVDDAHSSVVDLQTQLGDIADPSGGMGDLASRLDSLESDLSSATASIDDLTFGVDGIVTHFTECINDYMKTVGDAGGGRYTYYLC